MSTNPILSKEFAIIFGGEVIAHAVDFSLEINKETIDVTVLASNGWKEKIVDLREFGVSFNGLITRGETINSYLWRPATAYTVGQFVIIGGKCYEAQGSTTGHNPTTDGGVHWIEVPEYVAGTTYPSGEMVYRTTVSQELRIYKSLQAGNIGHEPTSSPTYWERIAIGYEAILNDLIENNSPVKVTIKPSGSATTFYYGSGYLTGVSGSFTSGDKASFSGKFESDGALSTSTTP